MRLGRDGNRNLLWHVERIIFKNILSKTDFISFWQKNGRLSLKADGFLSKKPKELIQNSIAVILVYK